MKRLQAKTHATHRRKQRIQKRVKGSEQRPRLSVHMSNTKIEAQIIADDSGKTVVSIKTDGSGSLSEQAAKAGAELAKKAKKAKITKVVFDRNGRKYHTRLSALADAARKEGLEF